MYTKVTQKYIDNYLPCCNGNVSIEAEIELILFGQICRLPDKYMVKQFFVHRLIRYLNGDKQVVGYIPDIYTLLNKFNLRYVLDMYSQDAVCPTKQVWKNTVKHKVRDWYVNDRNRTLQGLMSYQHISTLFQGANVSLFWSLCKENRSMKKVCYNAIYILGKMYSFTGIETCNKCNNSISNGIIHEVFYCAENDTIRRHMWIYILDCIGLNKYVEHILQDEKNQLCDILSGFKNYDSENDYNLRLCSCLTYLYRLCK